VPVLKVILVTVVFPVCNSRPGATVEYKGSTAVMVKVETVGVPIGVFVAIYDINKYPEYHGRAEVVPQATFPASSVTGATVITLIVLYTHIACPFKLEILIRLNLTLRGLLGDLTL